MKARKTGQQFARACLMGAAALMASGCASSMSNTASAPAVPTGQHLTGFVHGGQQPVAGATLHLYAAGVAGYGGTNTDLLTSTVQTDASGSFNLTGKYSCTVGQQMYLVALGGNPGAGVNPQVGLMAALGDCANLTSRFNININEVTTVGSVFALAPFMTSYSGVGTSANNVAGLKQAFASVNKLVNIGTGSSFGSALPASATGPSAKINTLADILASCVNSVGGVAGDKSVCGSIFSYATPTGGTPPVDTIGTALLIAKSPAAAVSSLIVYASPQSPFLPKLNTTPDWTLSITYATPSLDAPTSTTIDAAGNVWVANSGNNTITLLAQTGTEATGSPFSGNGLTAPSAVAIDMSGNGWVTNNGGSTVSVFSATGGSVGNYAVGTTPTAIAFDASGNAFIANLGSNSISELSASGTTIQTITAGVASPTAIAINPK